MKSARDEIKLGGDFDVSVPSDELRQIRRGYGSKGPRVFAPEIWSENVAHLGNPAVRCLSVASFGPRDVFASNLGSGRMSGSPFLAKQKR